MLRKLKNPFLSIFPLLRKHNTLNEKTKLVLYKSYILPVLTYACPVWANAAKTHIKKLQVMQNKCLRMVFNAPYCTRISALHDGHKIQYIQDFIQKLHSNFYSKIKSNSNPLIKNLGNYESNNVGFRVKHKLPKK